jgi:sugar (pentulose or hexulose) kinase
MFKLLPVDEHGQALTPMISWLDVRSTAQADRLEDADLATLLYQQTGNHATAKDIIPKLLWLKQARSDVWERTAHLLDFKEYLLLKLTGRQVTDWHGASCTLLFDPRHHRWSEAICRALGIPIERLVEARPCTEVIGEVSLPAASAERADHRNAGR